MRFKIGIKTISIVLVLLMILGSVDLSANAASQGIDAVGEEVEASGIDALDKFVTPEYHGGVKAYKVSDVIEEEENGDFDSVVNDQDIYSDAAKSGTAKNIIKSRNWYSYGTKYTYSKMSANQKKFYKDLYSYCMYILTTADTNSSVETNYANKRVINVNGYVKNVYTTKPFYPSNYKLSYKDIMNLYDIFLYENPQFYFLNYITLYNDAGTKMWFSMYANFRNSVERAAYTNKIFDKLDGYVAQVKALKNAGSDAAAIRKAELLIMANNRYGWAEEAKDAYGVAKTQYYESFDQSIYSSLMLGYTVCAGYSKAMQAILTSAGYRAISVTSRNEAAAIGHAWNMIYLKGLWYHIDATWDDNDLDYYGTYRGTFFMINDNDMLLNDKKDMHVPLLYWQMGGFPTCLLTYDESEGLADYSSMEAKSSDPKRFANLSSDFSAIYRPAGVKVNPKVTLSATKFGYNGKAKSPKVTVKVNGQKLSPEYYTVSMSKGRKKVGKYTVKVTLKNGYSGTKKVTFSIVPKKITLSRVSGGTGCIKVKWKRISNDFGGYQIQYSKNKKFKNAKSVKITKKTATSRVIANLNSGSKYYVRIRAYKKVKGKTYYSVWSKAKNTITR